MNDISDQAATIDTAVATNSERPREERYLLSPPSVGDEERAALIDAFDSGWIAPVGPQLDQFEAEFAAKVEAPAALALSSGTSAIHLGLRLLDIGPGDEVLVSSLTFAASANPVKYLGAQPVFVDSETATWNMDPDLLDEFLFERSRRNRLPAAVVVVDILGQCAQLTRIRNICDAYEIPIVEDAAEALGATHNARPAGTFGRVGAFSFNGNKTITTSGGGMLIGGPADIDRARYLSTQAKDPVPWYEHKVVGYNYRMSNLLAGFGLAQLRRLDELVDRQRDVKRLYRQALAGVDAVTFMPDHLEGRSSNWLTALTLDPSIDTEQVRQHLDHDGVEARAVWKPLHMQPAFAGCGVVGGRVSERLYRTGLCMPSGTDLTAADIAFIADSLQTAIEQSAGTDTALRVAG